MAFKKSEAELFLDVRCEHGEGPVWLEQERVLYFLDIPGQKLYWFDGKLRSYAFDRQITCVLPAGKGRFIASSFDELHFWSPESGLSEGLLGAARPFDSAIVRHNDGVIAPDGSLLMGCLHMAETDPVAMIYRFAPHGTAGSAAETACRDSRYAVSIMMPDMVIPNGIDFSPDKTLLYTADTGTWDVYRCGYAGGRITSSTVIASYDGKRGERPDGLVVDKDGNVWVAVLGGGRIEKMSPEGKLLESVSVPAKNTTSCCFGGAGLDVLYITTGMVDGDKQGGAVFSHRPGVSGQLFGRFREA